MRGVLPHGSHFVRAPAVIVAVEPGTRVENEVLVARKSKSRPTQGIVTFENRAYKQDDTLVCRAVRDGLMHTRPER
ncbi:MAG: hypothetical protein JRH01_04890 [Deltaproteobacteria bacterium]|nr:hypothetical protein [Deltaproteobacteria bacterium]